MQPPPPAVAERAPALQRLPRMATWVGCPTVVARGPCAALLRPRLGWRVLVLHRCGGQGAGWALAGTLAGWFPGAGAPGAGAACTACAPLMAARPLLPRVARWKWLLPRRPQLQRADPQLPRGTVRQTLPAYQTTRRGPQSAAGSGYPARALRAAVASRTSYWRFCVVRAHQGVRLGKTVVPGDACLATGTACALAGSTSWNWPAAKGPKGPLSLPSPCIDSGLYAGQLDSRLTLSGPRGSNPLLNCYTGQRAPER